MRVLICGDRNWGDADVIHRWIGLNVTPVSVVIHGGARGADRMAGRGAVLWGHTVIVFPALWDVHGRAAGYIRNQQMLDEGQPELVVYFHSNLEGSRGTKDMVARATKAGIPVRRGA